MMCLLPAKLLQPSARQLGCRTYILLPCRPAVHRLAGIKDFGPCACRPNPVRRRRPMNKREEAAVTVIIVLSCPGETTEEVMGRRNKCYAPAFISDTARATSFEAIFSQFFLTSSSMAVGFFTSS